MTKTFVAMSPVALEDKIARFAKAFDLVITAEILTVRDGKYIKTVRFV